MSDVRDEIHVLVGLAAAEEPGAARDRLLKELLRLVNRLAHRKHRAVFEQALAELRAANLAARGSTFHAGLEAVAERAGRRLAAAANVVVR